MLRWMLDLDLTSIGAPWHRFRGNSSLLQAEFADRPAAGWQQRTCLFLGALASQPRIYHSLQIAVAIEDNRARQHRPRTAGRAGGISVCAEHSGRPRRAGQQS